MSTNGAYLNKLLGIDAKHALYREDGKWYHNLKKFPGILFDKNGYILFQSEESYLSHPELQHKKDLHVKNGIQNLDSYRYFTTQEKLILGIGDTGIPIVTQNNSNEETIRVIRTVEIVLRKKALVDKIKKLYKNTCQICGTKLIIKENIFYSEVHHIVPLGRPHNGSDSVDNMICVCPNHHVLLDLKAIKLNLDKLLIVKHPISETYINYHNSMTDLY